MEAAAFICVTQTSMTGKQTAEPIPLAKGGLEVDLVKTSENVNSRVDRNI